jgi:hypothetical protein
MRGMQDRPRPADYRPNGDMTSVLSGIRGRTKRQKYSMVHSTRLTSEDGAGCESGDDNDDDNDGLLSFICIGAIMH